MNPEVVLVTGSPRSGTTWVGQMIKLSGKFGYIKEPMIPGPAKRGILKQDPQYWFKKISTGESSLYKESFNNLLQFNYNCRLAIKGLDHWKGLKTLTKDYIHYKKCKIFKLIPLIKDPIALFAADWISSNYKAKIIILIRHPAAVVSSILRLGWKIDCMDFLRQKPKIPFIKHFEKDIINLKNDESLLLNQAILLYNILTYQIILYQKNYPDWIFIKHEDLARNYLKGFKQLYDFVGVDFTPDIINQLYKHNGNQNPAELEIARANEVSLNSRINASIWEKRLNKEIIEYIYQKSSKYSNHFYKDSDW